MTLIAEPYRLLPLPVGSKCIRVLDVDAASNSSRDGGRIVGTLRIVDLNQLDQNESFTSLSYVWGVDPANRKPTIACSGVDLEVTVNCESALRHLRQNFGKLSIWIDAICINQVDDTEKVQQLPLMGDIYSKSTTVYVWLGNGTPESDRAMDYLATAGFVEDFFIEDDSIGDESSRVVHPRASAAFWSAFTSAWSSSRAPFPSQRKTPGIVPVQYPC
jgi:hypothetical protein